MMRNAMIEIDLIIQSHQGDTYCSDLNFTVHHDDYEQTLVIAERLCIDFNCRSVESQQALAKVSLIGKQLMTQPSVATDILSAASQTGVTIRWFTSSDTRMTWVVQQDKVKDMACLLHQSYLDTVSLTD